MNQEGTRKEPGRKATRKERNHEGTRKEPGRNQEGASKEAARSQEGARKETERSQEGAWLSSCASRFVGPASVPFEVMAKRPHCFRRAALALVRHKFQRKRMSRCGRKGPGRNQEVSSKEAARN